MPLLDTSSPVLTAEEAEAFLKHSARARIVATKSVSQIERLESESIPSEVWSALFKKWRRENLEILQYNADHYHK